MAWEELLPSKERWAVAGRELLPSLGGRWAIARIELRGAWEELLPSEGRWAAAKRLLLPSLVGRWATARVELRGAWEELLPSEGRWAAARRLLLPSLGGRRAIAGVELRGAWLLAKLLPCLTGWETKLDRVRLIALALVIFPSFLVTKILNLFTCLCLTLLNLTSLTLFMKSWNSLKCWADIIEASWSLQSSVCLATWSKMLLMTLTLACNKSFSAFLIICLALEVVTIDFNLMLTGINSLCRHLREKILWFL